MMCSPSSRVAGSALMVSFYLIGFTSCSIAGELRARFADSHINLHSHHVSSTLSNSSHRWYDSASAESLTPNDSAIHYGKLYALSGGMLGAIIGIHIYQQNGWWRDNRAPFHFREDLVYGLGVDKIGHFYGASLLTFAISSAVRSANVSETHSLTIGAAGALLFQTYIEVEDGFSEWGFDRVDFAADVAGAGWPLLQHAYPSLQNFQLKLSYVPSPLLDNPGGVGFKGQKHLIIDDYEGQTFWLSANVHALLPSSLESYWPDFLWMAVGYGARDIAIPHQDPYSVLYLSLDYDVTKLIPQRTGFLKFLSNTLNFIHLPAPAVRLSPSAVWYGLTF